MKSTIERKPVAAKVITMKEIDSLVELNETKGRNYFVQIVNELIKDTKTIAFSQDKYSKWDVLVEDDNGIKYIVEIKCRNMTSTKYNDFIMEESKRDFMLSKSEYIPLYVNFFTDGKALVWNIKEELNHTIEKVQFANRTTVNLAAGKVNKKCQMLLRDRAAFYDYTA
jgi:hypothetical protein